MRDLPLRESDQVTLDASGNGQVEITCHDFAWKISMCGVQTQPRPSSVEPELSVYINGQFVGGTQTGDLDADTTFNQFMQQGDKIQAVWIGGNPGDTAIMTLAGTKTVSP